MFGVLRGESQRSKSTGPTVHSPAHSIFRSLREKASSTNSRNAVSRWSGNNQHAHSGVDDWMVRSQESSKMEMRSMCDQSLHINQGPV